MVDLWLHILAILFLLIAGGILSAWKYALLFVRKSELETLEKSGDLRARTALKLLEKPDKISLRVEIVIIILTLTAMAIGIAFICDDLSGAVAKIQDTFPDNYCHIGSIAIMILSIGFLRMLFMESLPRRIAENKPLKLALRAVGPISFLLFIISVPTVFLNFISGAIIKILRIKEPQAIDGAAEEKIIDIIDAGTRTGEFDQTEQELIKSVFDFTDTTASQIMTPRTEMAAINIADSLEKIMAFIREEGYSRYPVYKEDLDHIAGIFFTRDLINILYDNQLIIIQDLIRPAYFVPDSKRISELLSDFQSRQEHMAIVLDEFGGTAGVITIEDIIEELVGEIQDEYDTEEEEFKFNEDGSAEVLAHMDVDDFNEAFGCDLPEDLADTIGGLIFTHLGELPKRKQKVQIDGVEFTITHLDGNSIEKVTAIRLPQAEKE
jgi:putative hemolysin